MSKKNNFNNEFKSKSITTHISLKIYCKNIANVTLFSNKYFVKKKS